MTQTTTIDGVSRTSVIKRSACEWVEHAYLGEIGTGSLRIDDDAGTISVVGHKTIVTEQSACTSWPRIFTGFVSQKGIGRTAEDHVYTSGASRSIRTATKDGNDLLTRYVIDGTDGKRPAETVSARITWLLASDYLSTLVNDFGRITYPTDLGMDATDYRGQRPGDVLAACAKKANFNYYVRWNYDEADWELVFRDDNAQTADTSSISISNVAADVNGTSVFAPFQNAELTEDPEDVYSDVYATYSKGVVTATRAATASAFVTRWGATDDSGIKTAAQATEQAEDFLWESHTEEHTLTVTIRMRAAYVGLIRAGQRVSVTMTHLATQGYDSATYFQVLRRRIRQPLDTDNDYDVSLDLAPQESGPPSVTIVQKAFGRGGEGGLIITLPNPPTIAANRYLVVAISCRNDTDPDTPNTSSTRPRFGPGAWTRMNGTQVTKAIPTGDGVSAWYKLVDSTDQSCWIAEQNPVVGVWELAGADPASATIEWESEASGGPNYDIGSAQTPAVGDVAIAVWSFGGEDWSWQYGLPSPYPWQSPNPPPNVVAGWTVGISKWSFDHYSTTAFLPAHPWTTIAYALGAGASLTARAVPGESHPFAGLYIVIPPA